MQERSSFDGIADTYTYRFAWSERRLEFFITCDEMPFRNPESSPYADQLLRRTKQDIRYYLTRLRNSIEPIPMPLHTNADAITRRSMLSATRDAALARSSDPDPWPRFTAEERSLLDEILLWAPVDTCQFNKEQLFHRATDAYHGAMDVLLIMAANRRDSGDADNADRLDRIRYGYERRFTRLNPNNRRKAIAFMADCLHECAAQLQTMVADYYPTSNHDLAPWLQSHADTSPVPPTAIMRAALHLGTTRYDATVFEHRYWPWLPETGHLQAGWHIRFGVDMYMDFQTVLDSLDRPFRIVQYQHVDGLPRFVFTPANRGSRLMPDALPESLHLVARLYEMLASRTCFSCGTQHDVRWLIRRPRDWRKSLCRRCVRTSRYWRREWDEFKPIPDDVLDDQQTRYVARRLRELGFDALRIHGLIATCLNETGQSEHSPKRTPERTPELATPAEQTKQTKTARPQYDQPQGKERNHAD